MKVHSLIMVSDWESNSGRVIYPTHDGIVYRTADTFVSMLSRLRSSCVDEFEPRIIQNSSREIHIVAGGGGGSILRHPGENERITDYHRY